MLGSHFLCVYLLIRMLASWKSVLALGENIHYIVRRFFKYNIPGCIVYETQGFGIELKS